MKVAVYGASGHTGRFVIAELLRRGHLPVAIGRDGSKLAEALTTLGVNAELKIASLDSPELLDSALAGAEAVINCAGPFLDTARPVIEAALRSGVHYFDVTAEQGSALSTLELDHVARHQGVALVPAAGFYGGLGDLLATAAMSDRADVATIEVAIALDSWWPTAGTRRTGQRNTAPRLSFSDGRFGEMESPATASWDFPAPFGTQDVIEMPLTETILIARHVPTSAIRNYISQAPLRDLRDPTTPEPLAADDRGRSNQSFVIDVLARTGDGTYRITASGRDIYAITAPIVVEAVERVVGGVQSQGGAFALGELVDAADFLQTLANAGDLRITSSEGEKADQIAGEMSHHIGSKVPAPKIKGR